MTNGLIEIVDSIPPRRSMRISATLAVSRSRYGLSLPLIFGLGVYALIAGHGGAVLDDRVTFVIPHVLARPHVLTLPILIIWVGQLVSARSEDRAPSPWLAALMVLWANLHGGYLFGLGLAGLLAVEALLLAADWRIRRRAAGGWAFFGVLAIGVARLTPYGLGGLLLPFRLTRMSFAMGQLVA